MRSGSFLATVLFVILGAATVMGAPPPGPTTPPLPPARSSPAAAAGLPAGAPTDSAAATSGTDCYACSADHPGETGAGPSPAQHQPATSGPKRESSPPRTIVNKA